VRSSECILVTLFISAVFVTSVTPAARGVWRRPPGRVKRGRRETAGRTDDRLRTLHAPVSRDIQERPSSSLVASRGAAITNTDCSQRRRRRPQLIALSRRLLARIRTAYSTSSSSCDLQTDFGLLSLVRQNNRRLSAPTDTARERGNLTPLYYWPAYT